MSFYSLEKERWFGTWELLTHRNHENAAAALLSDLFVMVAAADDFGESIRTLSHDGPQPVRTRRDDFVRAFREVAMEIIGDDDGDQLAHWLDCYRSDRREFQKLADDCVKRCIDQRRDAVKDDAYGFSKIVDGGATC